MNVVYNPAGSCASANKTSGAVRTVLSVCLCSAGSRSSGVRVLFTMTPEQVIVSRLCTRNWSRRFNPEGRRGGKRKNKNMKGSFLPDPQWIRKQRRSRGCSCVKTSGCITTMPLCSRLQPALNYVCAHSSPVILWIASLGGGVRTWGMAADCWQRAVASNLSVSIGSAAAAAAAGKEWGGGGGAAPSAWGEEIGLSCTSPPVTKV